MSSRLEFRSSSGVRGFTLIELMVLTVIIAILAAMLLPALARAQQETVQTGCISILKELGHALQTYVDENEDRLSGPLWNGCRPVLTPTPAKTSSSTSRLTWA